MTVENIQINYSYSDIPSTWKSQYDDIKDLHNKPVLARYIESEFKSERGNFCIEALPPLPSKEMILSSSNKHLEETQEEIDSWNISKKIRSIRKLQDYRIFLPFMVTLTQDFYNLLYRSYSTRQLRGDDEYANRLVAQGMDSSSAYKLKGNITDGTNEGLALIGYSGLGKSTAVGMMLKHIPQTIIHKDGNRRITQITYIMVSCGANSNFNSLYASMGKAIDEALGHNEYIYERLIKKENTLGSKRDAIIKLIEKHSIGCIIIDEIQMMDFNQSKENSIFGLMTIINETKVGLLVVGTDEASEKIFNMNAQTSRRFKRIESNAYTENIAFQNHILKDLFKVQWTEPKDRIQLNSSISEAFEKYSKGTIFSIIYLYKLIMLEYLSYAEKSEKKLINKLRKESLGDPQLFQKLYRKERPNLVITDKNNKPIVIDDKFIKKVAEKYLYGLQKNTKAKKEEGLSNEDIQYLAGKLQAKIDSMGQESQEDIMNEILQQERFIEFRTSVTSKVRALSDCSPLQIEDKFNELYAIEENKDLDEKTFARILISQLEQDIEDKKVAPKRKRKRKTSSSQIQNINSFNLE